MLSSSTYKQPRNSLIRLLLAGLQGEQSLTFLEIEKVLLPKSVSCFSKRRLRLTILAVDIFWLRAWVARALVLVVLDGAANLELVNVSFEVGVQMPVPKNEANLLEGLTLGLWAKDKQARNTDDQEAQVDDYQSELLG